MKKSLSVLTLASLLCSSISPLASATGEQESKKWFRFLSPNNATENATCSWQNDGNLGQASNITQVVHPHKDYRDTAMILGTGSAVFLTIAYNVPTWSALGFGALGVAVAVPLIYIAANGVSYARDPKLDWSLENLGNDAHARFVAPLPESMKDGSGFLPSNLLTHKGEMALAFFITTGASALCAVAGKGIYALIYGAPLANALAEKDKVVKAMAEAAKTLNDLFPAPQGDAPQGGAPQGGSSGVVDLAGTVAAVIAGKRSLDGILAERAQSIMTLQADLSTAKQAEQAKTAELEEARKAAGHEQELKAKEASERAEQERKAKQEAELKAKKEATHSVDLTSSSASDS